MSVRHPHFEDFTGEMTVVHRVEYVNLTQEMPKNLLSA